ncbi:basic blue protein-like, partial [Phalaenopsis equestris]|uniref:basic blue protein-like n=1 Tax=Phalaenopsis equestris TaxID=78828 RepID=UPI0009E3EC7B
FNYVRGRHNVLKVRGEAEFNSCNKLGQVPPLTSGNNSFIFITGGRKWYICAFEDHCQRGMKLSINVEEAEAPAPSPTDGYDNSAGNIATFGYYKYLVGLAAVLGVGVML